MTIIAKSAENDKTHSTAKQATVSRSNSKKRSAPASGGEKTRTHGLSKAVAETRLPNGRILGLTAAILLRYLAYKVREHGILIDGIKWARVNLDAITSKYPYLGRSTVDEAVLRLKEVGACEIKNLNVAMGKRKYDRTRCYHVPKKWMNLAEEEPRYFDSTLASIIGVPAAVIYYNFKHWIEELDDDPQVELAPADLATRLPFSKRTIIRAVRLLVFEQMIVPVAGTLCTYAKGPTDLPRSKADESVTKADKGMSKADETLPKADNDSIVDNCSSLEESSKRKPAAFPLHSSPFAELMISTSAEAIPTEAIALDAQREEAKLGSSKPADCEPPLMCTVASLPQLRQITREFPDLISNWHEESQQMLTDKVAVASCRFFRSQALEELHAWYGNEDAAHLTRLLNTKVWQFFHSQYPMFDLEQQTRMVHFYATLECIVGAFLYRRGLFGSPFVYLHGLQGLQLATYHCFIALQESISVQQKRQDGEWLTERRAACASRDEALEGKDDLAPAQKARVLRNGINARNEAGWIFWDGEHRTDQITVTKRGLKRAHGLFATDPALTPSKLLSLMDRGMAQIISRPSPRPQEFGPHCLHQQLTDLAHFINAYQTVEYSLNDTNEDEVAA